MKTRSRDVRSTRREVNAMKRMEFSDDAIKWQIDTVLDNMKHDDSPFPLPNGTQADPRQAWVLPSNEQEK